MQMFVVGRLVLDGPQMPADLDREARAECGYSGQAIGNQELTEQIRD